MTRLIAVTLASLEDAEAVREELIKLLNEYEVVSVADYLNLVRVDSSFSDEKMGWTELNNIQIKQVGENEFMLDLPDPKTINFANGNFPFLKGWWFVADVIDEVDDQNYEGWLVDAIGDTVIIETEPSKIRIGISIDTVKKFDAYRERPII